MLIRFNDLDRTLSWMNDVQRLFDDASGSTAGTFPRAVLSDDGERFVFTAEVPGMTERDLSLSLDNDVLTVRGERTRGAPEGYRVVREERPVVRFARSFNLPAPVDGDRVEAAVRDGVLTVTLPKSPAAKPRTIPVRAASNGN